MNLRQQLIQDRIEQTAKTLALNEDDAFLRLSHSVVTGTSLHAFDPSDEVDGGQDKQLDAITIEQDGEQAIIHILQVKNVDTFSSNVLIQIRNGLDWFFRKSKSDIARLSNVPLRDKINEYRSLVGKVGPANVEIFVHYITNAGTGTISDEFKQEQ